MDSVLSAVEDPPTLRTLFSDRSWPEAPPQSSSSLHDKTVLVTGAGGSLGRMLIRALRQQPVQRILALDASEHVLVQLRSQLSSEGPPVECVLGNVRHPSDRTRALAADPDTVIHAAAYKHVPFLEDRPIAAVENNLLATVDWERACRKAGVERFIFISTDKAVAPTNVMGRTKLWGERWLQQRRTQTTSTSSTPAYTTVRLCNLFGSRGSVVPRFLRHLRSGDPLPLTHPDMHRWFMTRADAATATLAALAEPPGTYVPTACLYVSIVTLARRLIQWSRPAADPEAWTRWVGRRPGERLHEALWSDDENIHHAVNRALSRVVGGLPSLPLSERIEALRTACGENESETVRSLLRTEEAPVDPKGPPPDPERLRRNGSSGQARPYAPYPSGLPEQEKESRNP